MHDLFIAIVLGIVEGVTEFLPISSTGHLLVCERWIGMGTRREFWKMFTIVIQAGAIAAVVVYFRERLMELLRGPAGRGRKRTRGLTPLEISQSVTKATAAAAAAAGAVGSEKNAGAAETLVQPPPSDEAPITDAQRGYAVLMIVLASTPLVIAYFADKWAERHMESPAIIAGALIVGGLLMMLIEWLPLNVTTRRIEHVTWKQALGIGGAQVLAAIFPGTSRSAATIMAGLVGGLSRPAAAEFSFFLAIPAMGVASAYKLLKYLSHTRPAAHEILLLAIGTIVSFFVAWAVIAGFMGYVRRHNFVPFAIYRIALGVLVLLLV